MKSTVHELRTFKVQYKHFQNKKCTENSRSLSRAFQPVRVSLINAI